jgi:hypothetical protein
MNQDKTSFLHTNAPWILMLGMRQKKTGALGGRFFQYEADR